MVAKTHEPNPYKLIALVIGVLVVTFILGIFGPGYLLNLQPQDQVADNIYDVKLEFIPQTVYAQCKVRDTFCSVSFQVKNVGTKTVLLSPGDFGYTTDTVNGEGIGIASNNQNVYLKPNEISKTLRVEIYTSMADGITTPVGTRTIKIPFQIYNSSSWRIGASDYYLPLQLTVVEDR